MVDENCWFFRVIDLNYWWEVKLWFLRVIGLNDWEEIMIFEGDGLKGLMRNNDFEGDWLKWLMRIADFWGWLT